MAENITTITDRGQFEKLFYKYFLSNPVYLKTNSGNLKIKFLGYSNGQVAFKIPFVKNIPDFCLVFSMDSEFTVYSHLKFAEKQEEDLYLFHPAKIQLISIGQRESRIAIGEKGGEGKKVVYVTNVISDFIIENSIGMSLKQTDRIKEIIEFDLKRLFDIIKVFFINEGMSDPRMKYFAGGGTPIFVVHIDRKPDEDKLEDYNFYLNNIYTKDYQLQNRKHLISEISVPVLYRGKIPYGYLQVNSSSVMTESSLSLVKRMAVVIEDLFQKSNIFYYNTEKLLVSDLSKKGVGIVFNERKHIRFFKERSRVFFELILPESKKASVLATVKNISLLEKKIIKVGCEINYIDALSEVHYDEFLESMGLSVE